MWYSWIHWYNHTMILELMQCQLHLLSWGTTSWIPSCFRARTWYCNYFLWGYSNLYTPDTTFHCGLHLCIWESHQFVNVRLKFYIMLIIYKIYLMGWPGVFIVFVRLLLWKLHLKPLEWDLLDCMLLDPPLL